MNNGIAYTNILSLAVNQSTGRIVAGTHCGGVFCSSDNGDTWEWSGLPVAQIMTLAVNSSGRFFAGVARLYLTETGGDIYHADDGITWKKVTPDNDAYFSFAINSAGHIYAGTGFYQYVPPFNINDYGDIYRSTNNGASWSRVASKLDDFVYALAVDTSGQVFAGTREGIYKSSGGFWNKVSPNNTRSLIVNPATGCIFAGTSGGIWRSCDGGNTWEFVHPMPGNFTWSLAINSKEQIFAGTQRSGVLVSSDNGNTWAPFSSGLPSGNEVRSLAIHHATGRIFAGTNGRGVFRHVETPTSVAETQSPNGTPEAFVLYAPYPNPFNPSTTLRYDLPQQAEVKFMIFDVTGRHVSTLVDQTQGLRNYKFYL